MNALDATGERAAALQHARVYELLVRNEVGGTLDASVLDVVNRARFVNNARDWSSCNNLNDELRAVGLTDVGSAAKTTRAVHHGRRMMVAVVAAYRSWPPVPPSCRRRRSLTPPSQSCRSRTSAATWRTSHSATALPTS
jgi:hypothetical protein